MFPAWTYNGRVPGPTLRATEGDRLRIVFRNYGSHPHSMHFHGIHAARMDGVPGAGLIGPGEEFVYEFDARPFGCHLYHCHALPLKRHMHKGMYGAFIIDPDPARHPEQADVARSRLLGTPENAEWQEMVMVMNAFDTNFDGENEVYAANTIAHCYAKTPIRIVKSRPVRIYLVNVVEFDPINSFHLHANFFDYFDQGTTLTPTLKTVDLIMQCQAQRGILEFTFKDHEPGLYMFHAHQSEFTELGWVGHVRRRGGRRMSEAVRHRPPASPAAGAAARAALAAAAARRARPARSPGSFAADPLQSFDNGAPPVEKLTFERTILDPDGHRACWCAPAARSR